MNHKNIDVHIYSKYRFFICFKQYLYTSETLKNKKKQKRKSLADKKIILFKKIKICIHTVPTSRKLYLSRYECSGKSTIKSKVDIQCYWKLTLLN